MNPCFSARFLFFWLISILFLVTPAGQVGASVKAKASKVQLGQVTVTLAGPEGLARVDGLRPQADAYIKKTASKLKFQAMALYADPGEWAGFVADAAGRRPADVPRFALLGTTTSMPGKSYDLLNFRRELARYDKWFSLAAGNRPLAALLTRQGNKKLAEVMGVDIGFEFKVDQFTRKFDQSSDSLSLGAKVAFNVFGRPSQVFLTVTALSVGDKIVYLAYFEKDGREIKAIEERARGWRRALARLNADQYKPKGS
ncbi:MAG: hypothetical protein FWG97_04285 [Deltaproteobacteria bacterium]|nr:hypothetical protein [Deltaproteobacteria bacterium]